MDYKNPLKLIDPLTGMEMTMQTPMPANQMGAAKPMFNQTAQDIGNQVYGTPLQRQMSMPQPPVFMSAKQAENLPPELVAEIKKKEVKEVSKNSSPVDFHEGVSHDRTMKPKMTKTLVDKPKVTTAYNSSYTGNPDVSNRVYNAATGLSINEDSTYNYKKASQYEANAIQQYGSLEAARKALYNKRNK